MVMMTRAMQCDKDDIIHYGDGDDDDYDDDPYLCSLLLCRVAIVPIWDSMGSECASAKAARLFIRA